MLREKKSEDLILMLMRAYTFFFELLDAYFDENNSSESTKNISVI